MAGAGTVLRTIATSTNTIIDCVYRIVVPPVEFSLSSG
jgi:hypothetical protein